MLKDVSILVLVDVGLRQALESKSTALNEVSILVLVDVGLRLIPIKTVHDNGVSFNPCFSGCWSATREALLNYVKSAGFQSLF